MTLPALRDKLEGGGHLLAAWCSLGDPVVHETLLAAGFEALVLDMQHGQHDTTDIAAGIALCAHLGRPSIVRVPIEDRAMAARALDFGASAIIMPMIQGDEDARAFVAAVKYPPRGERSFGPARAVLLHGYDSGVEYVADARGETLAIAMIETAAALDSLDAILAIDGLDGVFVGPADLSIALSGTGTLAARGPKTDEAVARIAKAATAAGKFSAIYAGNAEDARHYRSAGVNLVCIGSDMGMLRSGADAILSAINA
ncbi:HpcH/HpaI aldolase family protein [Mangrovicella endophytica]|uniref:HpcH/HpaI aldolase family protein n=1 Tax=Mangrovicella endophytica TaxID=2066697 RepID=UPI000C9EC015|nr:aldolase/citrate lyase family protein [Mangrovicella endophytica]